MRKQLGLVLAFTLGGVPVFAENQSRQRERMMESAYHSDSELAAMARRSLERDDTLSSEAKNINIRVKDGRAFLQGNISSPAESQELKKKVMAVEGIKGVENRISISE